MQQWNDQSGGSYNATQLTAGKKPTYKTNILNGQPVLRFNGAHNMATTSFLDSSFNTSFTFFIVETKSNTTIQVTTSNQGVTWYSGGHSITIANTNNLSPTQITQLPVWAMTSPTVHTFKYDGAHATLRWDGLVPKSVSTTGNLGLSGSLTIGSLSTNNFYYQGDIAEIVIYNSALDDTQMGQIESYLMTKYGITATSSNSIPLFFFDGDSMTSGVGSTGGLNYPNQVQTLLGLTAYYGNLGVPGRTVLQMSSAAPTQIDSEYQSLRTTNVVTLLGGTNDLYFGADATTTYNRIVSYSQGRRTAGFKVIVNTILPRSNDGTPVSFEADRQTINNSIRSNWTTFADGISDVASDSIIGPAGAELNTTYYGDKVHMTNTGYGVVASYVTAAIKQIMNPITVSGVSVTPSTTTATITWTTNQTGSTKVNYGLTSSYGSSTAETDTATRVLSHSASLSSLVACTTYNFQAVSNDLNGNQAVSTNQTFTTTGCLPTTPITLQQFKNDGITAISSGGWTNQTSIILKFSMSSQGVTDTLTPEVEVRGNGISFSNTFTNSGNAVFYSGSPVTGSVTVTGLTDGTIYHWQASGNNSVGNSSWVTKGGSPDFGVDTSAPSVPGTPTTASLTTNTKPVWTWTASTDSSSGLTTTPYSVQWCGNSSFTGCDANTDTATTNTYTHATTLADGTWYFRVKATDAANNSSAYSSNGTDTINTVVTTISSSSSNNSSSTSTACSDQTPGAKAPWLYGAIAQDSGSVLLYFTEADNPVNKYVLEYGTKSGDYPYGVQDMGVNSRGQMTFLVKSLSSNTTYYFKVRGGNGCATGTWSNEISAKTKGLVSFNQLEITQSELEPQPVAENPNDTSCQTYTVINGDTLWSIAKKLLGDGNKYKTIIEQNKGKYSSLNNSNNISSGWEIKINCGKQTVTEETKKPTETQGGYDVKVKVVDTAKKPIEGATVTLHSTPQTTKTDKNGVASFSNVEAGDHKVLIAYNNFEGEQSVNLTGDVKEFDLNVTVQQKAVSLSPLAYGIIGIMGLVIIGLIVLLIKGKRKSKNLWIK